LIFNLIMMFLALKSCDPALAGAGTYFPAARRHRPNLVETNYPAKEAGTA
jgi:hypothetical protein